VAHAGLIYFEYPRPTAWLAFARAQPGRLAVAVIKSTSVVVETPAYHPSTDILSDDQA
jgi:hypothetical protein